MPYQKILRLLATFIVLAIYTSASRAVSAPTNIACQGWEEDTARISWQDTQEDVTEYRVQRNIDGGGWNQIAVIDADDSKRYDDTGIDTSKNNRYRVQAFFSGDDSTALSNICNNRRIYETDNYRIFYGVRGTSDDCPKIDGNDVCLANVNTGSVNRYVKLAGDALEGSVDAFERVGFGAGKATNPPSGLDKIPINVVWCDGGGCAGGGGLGLSPFLLEKAFDTGTRVGDPAAYIVSLHEAFHFLQGAYPGLSDPGWKWVFEGQARSIQDKFCIGDDRSDCEHFDDIDSGYAGYVPEIADYMVRTDKSINQSSYEAVLFWTYLTEKFGTAPADDSVEGGMDVMVKFWESIEANPDSDGITGINIALDEMGYGERFVDIWKDFSVANYAKNLTGGSVPAAYQYADMQEPGGTYSNVGFELDQALTMGDQLVGTGQFLPAWGAHYYRLQPDAGVDNLDIKITQDSTSTIYYTILGIKGDDIDFEQNVEGRHLEYLLPNDAYDEVVIIVATLGSLANYRYSINGIDPVLNIVRPTTGNEALVGDPLAPEKFLLAVELVDGDGVPLADVDLNGFTFTVGSEVISGEDIINSAKIQGQQWFTLRAPPQASDGYYNLEVSYSASLSATETNAVRYAPRDDIDSMITVDRSGSMQDFNKLISATDAAKLFIDSWRDGDKIGLVSFNGSISLDQTLTDWTDSPGGGSRQTVFDLLDGLTASGSTALGDAAQASWDELADKGDPDHSWGIVLLSDGLQTDGTETLDSVSENIKDTSGDKPAIHAIAIGPDADQQGMQLAANRTNGTYQYVSEPIGGAAAAVATNSAAVEDNLQLQLDKRYRVISSKIDRTQQVFSLRGPQADGQPLYEEVIIPIENSAAEMVFSLSFDGIPFGEIKLYDPNDTIVPIFKSNGRHLVWRVPSPMSGNWRLVMQPPIIGRSLFDGLLAGIRDWVMSPARAETDFLPPYLIHVTLISQVTMETYLPVAPEDRISAVPMPVLVNLTDTAPITGAAVNAFITSPAGSLTALTLLDDGSHGDGAANDGIYGNTYTQTHLPGSYIVDVTASGVSPLSGNFQREDSLAFFIYGGGDTDGDNIPDAWETANGTDPTVDDSSEDPDNDGLPNAGEWEKGTDPFDPDTDNGGEADGTDDNPLDPSDDRIGGTWVVAYPDNARIYAFYVLRPEYVRVDVLRSLDPAGPYTPVSSLFPGDGLFVDETVVNDTEYCYLAIAFDVADRQSAPINPSCATPKEDAFAPHGFVTINDDLPVTVVPDVTLNLWASDTVDPESVFPADENSLPESAPASGVTEMMISNSPGFSGSIWEPYATTRPWTLSPSGNSATVYVKYRDAYLNESEIVSDSIRVATLDPAICSADPLGRVNDFSYFILGDARQTASKIEGRVAIAANADIRGAHIATQVNGNAASDDTLIVGSDITFDKGVLFAGNLVYGGLADITANVRDGTAGMGYPINFGIEALNLQLMSQIWSTLPANGSVSLVPNGAALTRLVLEGHDPVLNVFELGSDQLNMAGQVFIHTPKSASVLINVSGTQVQMNDVLGLTKGATEHNILYNFFETETASMAHLQLTGSLLMPGASLTFDQGILRGSLIAGELEGNKNIVNNGSFESCLPLPVYP